MAVKKKKTNKKPSQKKDNENSGNGNQAETVEEKLPEEVMGVTMDKSSIEEIKEGFKRLNKWLNSA